MEIRISKIITILSFLFAITACAKKAGTESPEPRVTGIGIDLSHHNPEPDWDKLDVDFIILKATEGATYRDPTFYKRREQCINHNIPVGAYHFFTGINDAMEEFRNFSYTVGHTIDIIPVIDAERIPKNVNKEAFKRNLHHFCYLIYQEYGVLPIVYTSEPFYDKYIKDVLEPFQRYYPLWYGDIGKKYSTFETEPEIHQREIKALPGTKGKVDVNYLYVDLENILLKQASVSSNL